MSPCSHLFGTKRNWGARAIPDFVALLHCLLPSQNVIQSAETPRTEATQPNTIVPISLGPQREHCWRPSDDIGTEVPLIVNSISGQSVPLAGILLMTCVVLYVSYTVFLNLWQGDVSLNGFGRGYIERGSKRPNIYGP